MTEPNVPLHVDAGGPQAERLELEVGAFLKCDLASAANRAREVRSESRQEFSSEK